MSFHWSPQQEAGIAAVSEWYKRGDDQVFYLAGYAGTGKTTIARHLVAEAEANPCYGAFTGKAAAVMRNSGCADAGTLHSKMYKFKQDPTTGRFTKRKDKGKSSPIGVCDLIVVDECSMVDQELGEDLCSFKKPILVLGDPAQLPPVKGGGYFTSREPNVMLTEIHRQAEGNPIIKLATDVRSGKGIDLCSMGDSHVVTKSQFREAHDITKADQVLVGRNATRRDFNIRLREINGYNDAMPVKDDRLVCLKNSREQNIFNGGMFRVVGTFDASYEHHRMIGLEVVSEDDGEKRSCFVRREFFTGEQIPHWTELRGTQQFAYGYALTVHKAQGSQWDHVVLFDEAFGNAEERQRWLYTGITRAAKSIKIVR